MVLKTNFRLRQFKLSDMDEVIRINRICLPENYTTLFFMNLFRRFPKTFIIAENNGETVGYIMCRIETGIPSFKILGITKKGHIISIAVLPEHQKKGLGFSLVQRAMQAMMGYNAKECYLEVRTSNQSAVELYKKLGFEVIRTIKNYYADREDALVMAKHLSSSTE
jgi:ribosomal-protein-alanine N-acetyltransferase